MRWRYYDNETPEEIAERAHTLAKIDTWWQAFSDHCSSIDQIFGSEGESDFNLPGFMQEYLQSIHPDLMWEFGPAVLGARHRLVITPEVEKRLHPLLDVTLASRPKLPGWEFYSYRMPESLEMAEATVQARLNDSLEGTEFCLSTEREEFVDLVYVSERASSDHEALSRLAFVLTETLLGEYNLNTWIGYIDVCAPEDAPDDPRPLAELKPVATDAIAELESKRPNRPYHEIIDDLESVVLGLPEEVTETLRDKARDADSAMRDDIYVGQTQVQGLWHNTRSNKPIADERFSAHGETFAYLKFSLDCEFNFEDTEARSEIGDAIESLLIPTMLGCVVGGGLGVSYAYIDLALTNVNEALPLIRQVCADRGFSERSWLLFFDSRLRDEWLGIFEDTPEPPCREDS